MFGEEGGGWGIWVHAQCNTKSVEKYYKQKMRTVSAAVHFLL